MTVTQTYQEPPMRKPLVLTVSTLALAGLATVASPALATCTPAASGGSDICMGTTQAAFTVASGTIAIQTTLAAAGAGTNPTGTAPSTVLTGSQATATVPLGATVVTDLRVNSSGWTMSASTTDFTLAGSTTTKIPLSNAAFSVPVDPAAVAGAGVSAPLASTFSSKTTTPTAVDANGSTTLLVSNSTGANAATFIPVLTVNVPSGKPTGLYSGVVTQSLS